MKRSKKKTGKLDQLLKTKVTKADADVSFRLEQPIQTALYAKLCRLGYDA